MGGDPHQGRYSDIPIFRARPSPSVPTFYGPRARAVYWAKKVRPPGEGVSRWAAERVLNCLRLPPELFGRLLKAVGSLKTKDLQLRRLVVRMLKE
jgi:hypothetical protein